MIHYEFAVRFRYAHESEGRGSLRVTVVVPDSNLTTIRHAMHDLTTQHPAAVFDGMIFYGSTETS